MEWMKQIPGLNGQYSITRDGRVYSHKSKKFLSPTDNGSGYLGLILCVDGKPFHEYIHRLVAETYIPNPQNLPEINHKDENKANNTVENLEWCTSAYNKNFGNRAKKYSVSRGKPVVCIDTGEQFHGVREAARCTGIPATCISAACTGYRGTKTAGGFHWGFVHPKELRG